MAAADKLRRVNSSVTIEPIVADIEPSNIERFCDSIDVILDGTDNFETRYMLNDASLRWNIASGRFLRFFRFRNETGSSTSSSPRPRPSAARSRS